MMVFNVCANDSVQLLYKNITFLMEEMLMIRFIMWVRTAAHSLCYHTRLPNIFFCLLNIFANGSVIFLVLGYTFLTSTSIISFRFDYHLYQSHTHVTSQFFFFSLFSACILKPYPSKFLKYVFLSAHI